MFAARDTRRGAAGTVDVAFTDRHGGESPEPFASLDLSVSSVRRQAEVSANFALLATEFGVDGFRTMRQVHGRDTCHVDAQTVESPMCDALFATESGVALCVRVADCVPVIVADAERGVIGAAHAGRPGVLAGVVPALIESMRAAGAAELDAWIGPHVCGGCYEVPAELRDEVAAAVPATFACTTWGTPSLDLGAGVRAQLKAAGCRITNLSRCTRESPDLYSYRRDGASAGRAAGLVVLRHPA